MENGAGNTILGELVGQHPERKWPVSGDRSGCEGGLGKSGGKLNQAEGVISRKDSRPEQAQSFRENPSVEE